MMMDLAWARFTGNLANRADCIAAYERNNEEVRQGVPPERLVVWEPGDGWEPLCAALELPVPTVPYPLINTREQFLSRLTLQT